MRLSRRIISFASSAEVRQFTNVIIICHAGAADQMEAMGEKRSFADFGDTEDEVVEALKKLPEVLDVIPRVDLVGWIKLDGEELYSGGSREKHQIPKPGTKDGEPGRSALQVIREASAKGIFGIHCGGRGNFYFKCDSDKGWTSEKAQRAALSAGKKPKGKQYFVVLREMAH